MRYPAPGELLVAILRRYGIPQHALAQTIGIRIQGLTDIFSGRRNITPQMALYLYQALPHLPPNYWVQADALHRLQKSWPTLERRNIKPLIRRLIDTKALNETACLCTHQEPEHREGRECRICICPVYLPAASVEAYNKLLELPRP